MQKNDLLSPSVQYNIIWFIIGAVLLLLVIVVYMYIFWTTRKKKIRTLATLPVITQVHVSIDALREKYLKIITTIEFQYQNKEIDLRQLHLLLSTTVRLFVYEVKGISVHKLTLTEIKNADLVKLYDVIVKYYPLEFDSLQNGDANNSVALAKGMVQQWS